jgi:hypothetical protein
LVSGTTDAATCMSGVENDPAAQTDSEKLDQLLGLVNTMNTRLDRQSQRLTTVESTIPLLAQVCSVVLPTGSSGRSSGTATGTGAGGGSGVIPATRDDQDPGNGQDSVAIEPARNGGGGMGPGRGSGGTAHGVGPRGMAADWAAAVSVVTAVMTQGRVNQKLAFPPSMVRAILCLGSTNVPHTSTVWVHQQMREFGWLPFTSTALRLSGIMP